MHHPTERIAHTMAFVTPVVEHWLVREIAQWVHHMKDRSNDPRHHERTPLPRSYISLLAQWVHPMKDRSDNPSHHERTPLPRSYISLVAQWVHPMKDRSDDPSHHERTPLPRSYISLPATCVKGKNGKILFHDGNETQLYGRASAHGAMGHWIGPEWWTH